MKTSLREKDDKELSKLAAAHNNEAFDVLIERHEEYIMAISQRYTDTYHEAQDIFQKGCLKAWRAIPNFRQDCHFKTWIYRVVRSAAFDHNSWKKRKAEVSFESFFTSSSDSPRSAANRGDTEIGKRAGSDSPFQRKGSPTAKEWGTTLFELIVAKTSQPDKVLEILDNNKELNNKLNTILENLSPEHRQCLECIADGMTYEEMAKMQKVSIGTIMSRVFYARKKAKRLCFGIKNYNQNV
tara:strand:- start:240 stop:959 length:720 start_codon:yes stop_codon:yes gene_type:complete